MKLSKRKVEIMQARACMNTDDLLMQIMMLDFAVQDSALFLDTHPNDKEALNYYQTALSKAVWGKDLNTRKELIENIEYIQNKLLE